MSISRYFKLRKKSAKIAKDRLHIIIAQERTEGGTPDFLPKYTEIDIDQVKVDLQCKDNNSVLELNVTLPDAAAATEAETAASV